MKRQQMILIVMGFGLITLFQNCGQQMSFGVNGAFTKIAVSDQPVASSGSASGSGSASTVGEGGSVSSSSSNTPSSSTVGEGSASSSSSSSSSSSTTAACTDKGNGDNDDDDSDSDNDAGYICILKGPGESQALGFVDNKFESQNAVPNVVCMSQYACEKLVSQKFDVKFAAKRGYCGEDHDSDGAKNMHAIIMNDVQVKANLGL